MLGRQNGRKLQVLIHTIKNKICVLAIAGMILAAIAIGNASADVNYSYIKSQVSGSQGSVSASWVTTNSSESSTIGHNDVGNIYCKNYYQNSADKGTLHAYWIRDVYNTNGIISPDFDDEWAIDVPKGQTEWVTQQAPIDSGSKPTGSYRFEQMDSYYNSDYSQEWNPNPFTQKGLVIT